MELNMRKLFVGGLSHFTTEESLREHFSQYGDIKDLEIIKDRHTCLSRGFGFVTFSDSSSSDRALADDRHVIMEKEVAVKIAIPKPSKYRETAFEDSCLINPTRIFVGGLPQDVLLKEFREYFKSFGTVVGVEIPRNHRDVNKLRGFGYVTFDSQKTVDEVLSIESHKIRDKTVEVRRATYPRKIKAVHQRLACGTYNRALCSHEEGFENYSCYYCSCHGHGGMASPMPYYVWWNGSWYYYPHMFEYQKSISDKSLGVGEMISCKSLSNTAVLRISEKDKGSNQFKIVNDTHNADKIGYDGTSKNQETLNVQLSLCIKSSALLVDEVGLKGSGYEDQNGTCKSDKDELRVAKVGIKDQTRPIETK